MASSNACSVCWNQRWQVVRAGFDKQTDKLVSSWRPFGRDVWSEYGDAQIAALLSAKALRACVACNPNKLAPWASAWKAEATTAAAPQQGSADATPI
jgi:hypothetical protein